MKNGSTKETCHGPSIATSELRLFVLVFCFVLFARLFFFFVKHGSISMHIYHEIGKALFVYCNNARK